MISEIQTNWMDQMPIQGSENGFGVIHAVGTSHLIGAGPFLWMPGMETKRLQ